ncbi:MAG: hypothetical protein IPK19_14820 [Chloroflexi bacterium]|nr:hypothetical protein [Chloroflexota bacterium]
MSDLRLYLFGTPELEYRGTPIKIERRKALALAAMLALAEGRQSRSMLANLLWPDLDEEHGRTALRSVLTSLTSPVPVDWLQADRATLAIAPDSLWADVSAFVDLLGQSATHGHGRETLCEQCIPLFQQALDLYRGDFMTGFSLSDSEDFDDWQMMQREWLRRELAEANRKLSQYYADARQYEPAVQYARDWLAVDPLHEPAHRQLMRLYAASGQRSEALRQYKACVAILEEELAALPEDETTQLYQAIQNERLSPEAPVGFSSTMPPMPPLIIGREESLQAIKARLGIGGTEMHGTTVIQGWPGVGKSTIVAMIAHDPDVARQFPDGILWACMGENPDITGWISSWADSLRLTEPNRARRVEDMSAQITAALRDKRMLLILDDVWQAQHASPFQVGGQGCALIMTSRLNDVAADLAPAADDIYRLPVLSQSSGLELLARLSPDTVANHPHETRELVSDLEGLPLAIHVAGRLLHSEARLGWGVGDLLAELRQGASLLQAHPPSGMIGVERELSPTVAALLKRSTDSLDAETRQRFAFLGLFVPKPATFDLAAMSVVWDTDDVRPIARKLVDRGLMEPISGGRFQMHALLALHARSLLDVEVGGSE